MQYDGLISLSEEQTFKLDLQQQVEIFIFIGNRLNPIVSEETRKEREK